MIIPGARFKKLQRLIASIVSSTHLPLGQTVEINRIEEFLRCGCACRRAVDLIEFLLPHVNNTVYLSLINTGNRLMHEKIMFRNIMANPLGKENLAICIFSGRHTGAQRRAGGAISYKLDMFETTLEFDSRLVLGAKGNMLIFQGGSSVVIKPEVE